MNKMMNIKNLLIALIVTFGLSVSIAQADSPSYSVDGSNYNEYADMLSPGQMAMFASYPDSYRMDVYATGSFCTVPADIKAISVNNGVLINDNEGFEVENRGQIPFPDPTHPQHFVWNYRMNASHTPAIYRIATSANVQSDGSIVLGVQETNVSLPRNPDAVAAYADQNIFAMFMQKNMGPPRSAGVTTLVHDFIDSYIQPRKAWQYNPATRRVRRAPDITYDTVLLAGGGIVVVDQYAGYNGAQDKYDWSYEGSKLMLVPMSNDALADNAIETTHSVNHLNPDFVRFEERDVHIVHAILSPGQRHLYASRTFYFGDDDYGQMFLHDAYDGQGQLMRHTMQPTVTTLTSEGTCNTQGEYTFDFATRTYTGNNLLGSGFSPVTPIYEGAEEKAPSFYTPDGLRRYAR